MRRKKLYMRVITILTSTCLVAGSLTGCGSAKNAAKDENVTEKGVESENESDSESEEKDNDDDDANKSISVGGDLFSSIQANFSSGSADTNYNKTIYDVPQDYEFEFECSEELEYICVDAFSVYNNTKGEWINYAKCEYDGDKGVIRVSPEESVVFTENGMETEENNRWGSMNQLYLFQNKDLETGEDLDEPIITPFTVEQDLYAPAVSQSVDEMNNYTLSWQPVDGATKYCVFEMGDSYYDLCCVTEDTSVSVSEFEKDKSINELTDLFRKDLEEAGYDMEEGRSNSINDGVHITSEDDGRFCVIAMDDDGKNSGASNVVDARTIANIVPFTIAEGQDTFTVSSVEDMPAYIDVEMIDGSIAKMVIDYHGAEAYRDDTDPNCMKLKVHVANTLLDGKIIEIKGIPYDDIVDNKQILLDRGDELIAKKTTTQPTIEAFPRVDSEYDDEDAEDDNGDDSGSVDDGKGSENDGANDEYSDAGDENDGEDEIEDENDGEDVIEGEDDGKEEIENDIEDRKDDEDGVEDEGNIGSDIEEDDTNPEDGAEDEGDGKTQADIIVTEVGEVMSEVCKNVEDNINYIGKDKVDAALYANSSLEAWMSYCLIAQSEIIPVPVEVFPDAANQEYLAKLFTESFRQNPSCGLVRSVSYDPAIEAIIVSYPYDTDERIEKEKKEFEKAYEIATSECDSSMSDYDKVLALNEYFRTNASYDYDSTATDIDDSDLTEGFLDAHMPYGILCNDYGVCESYSEAFALTSRMAGLESICDFGTLYGGAHEWNRVKVDGNWCILDITNNDVEYYTNGLLNVSDDQTSGILLPENIAVLDHNMFYANDEENEYYYVNEKSAEDISEAIDMICEILDDEDEATVRIPNGTSEEEAKEIVQGVYDAGYDIQNAGYNLGLIYVSK